MVSVLSTPWRTFLVRYGELGIKSDQVRGRFERILCRNIEDAFLREGVQVAVKREYGRVYVVTPDEERGADILRRTFGVVSFSPVSECGSTLDEIKPFIAEYSMALLKPGQRFAVRARRTGDHKFTSMDAGREAGSAIFLANEAKGVKVDLSKPDVEIHLEVRQKRAFVFAHILPGPGGLPLSSQGKVVGIIDDVESAIACWMIMKRGAGLVPVVFEDGVEAKLSILKTLSAWAPRFKLRMVPVLPGLSEESRYRFQVAVAMGICRRTKAAAVVTGERVGELGTIPLIDPEVEFPIMRPVLALEDDYLDGLAQRIGFEKRGQWPTGQSRDASDLISMADAAALAVRALDQATDKEVSG
ncbi:MAG: tRNA sulfurtransferase [Euryarchaeota archaeon]|nr:tRNA sulfurtransferase [Euryarchaeota archaeon]